MIALTAFINLLKLTIPLYIFQLLDRVIASRSMDTLIMLTAIAGFAVVIAALAEVVRRSMLSHWGLWIESYFGKELFLGSVHARKVRGPSKALEDLAEVSQFVGGGGAIAWLDAFFAPAFLLLVYLIHPLLAAIVLAGMLLMLALGVANDMVTRPMRAAARKARLRSEGWVSTAEQQLRTVAGLNIGDRLAERWHKSVSRRTDENLAHRFAGVAIGEAMRFVESAQRIACYGLGVWLAVSGSLSVGGIIAAAVLGRIGTSAVRRAMSNWRQLALVMRAYQRIGQRLAAVREPGVALRDLEATQSLKLERVTYTHSSWARPVFRNLDLHVQPGEMLCLLGPSGSGKSTLARLIAGEATPTQGAVSFGGLAVARFARGERQQLIGYLQQDTQLLSGTIAENISSLREADDQAIVAAAKLAGIHDVIAALPNGYETDITPHNTFLAGGEIRRIGIARALFGKPGLVVLDEPEANLDDALVGILLDALVAAKSWGSVVVVTAQTPRLATVADKIIVLGSSLKGEVFASPDDYAKRKDGR